MMTQNETPRPPEPPPIPTQRDQSGPQPPMAEPLASSAGVGEIIDAILKRPMSVIARLKEGQFGGISARLVMVMLVTIGVYSLVVASFSGEEQWMYAPAKCIGGLLVTMIICLPSMHIFACLSGAEIRFSASASLMIKAVTLSAILLTGFAPVSWVFSQSTNSLYVMGLFHLIFWGISMLFGMKILLRGISLFDGQKSFMSCWVIIFLVTSLQMMTALRPIIGRSEDILPKDKKFFLQHWIDNASSKTE